MRCPVPYFSPPFPGVTRPAAIFGADGQFSVPFRGFREYSGQVATLTGVAVVHPDCRRGLLGRLRGSRNEPVGGSYVAPLVGPGVSLLDFHERRFLHPLYVNLQGRQLRTG